MVQVEIALYDLLPPGKLSSTFYYLGVGIYHTSIRIPELQVEFAYGGILPGSHTGKDVSVMTGIFVLPSPENPRVPERLMPGLRFIKRMDVGEAYGEDWRKNVKPKIERKRHESIHKPLPPLPEGSSRQNRRRQRYRDNLSSSSSSGNLPLLPYEGVSPYSEDQSFSSMATTDEWGRKLSTPPSVNVHHPNFASDDPLTSSPVTYSAPGPSPFSDRFAAREHVHVEGDNHQKQSSLSSCLPLPRISNPFESSGMSLPSTASELSDILALIDEMKLEPEWSAARYHLLLKNCNSFTSELCYRLTGRKAPAWINRAAWLAQSLPCLVPEGWLDPPTAEELQEFGTNNTSADQRALDAERPTSPLVAVPYVQTSPMHADVHYEGVQAR